MNTQPSTPPETIPIWAALHLPPKALFALVWQRAQQNAFKYAQEFDRIAQDIKQQVETREKEARQATQEMPAFPLQLDDEKRPCLAVSDFIMSTIDLVELVVNHFYQKIHLYPEVIYIAPRRWSSIGETMKYLVVSGLKIPYVRGTEEYDVCCKGAPVQA